MIKNYTRKKLLNQNDFKILLVKVFLPLTFCFPTSILANIYVVDNNSNIDNGAGYIQNDKNNSLNKCIRLANQNGGPDIINFSKSLAWPVIIHVGTTPIIQITDQVTIDGTTAPGYFTGSPSVVIDGDNIDKSIIGVAINGAGTIIKALVINHSVQRGIYLLSDNVTISGCFIGTDITGNVAISTRVGIEMLSNNNTIGGTSLAERNIISGNVLSNGNIGGGVITTVPATGNVIIGNYIGTNKDGTAALGNDVGILLRGTNGSVISGGNLISGNLGLGILIQGESNTNIKGNTIGLNATGSSKLANLSGGIKATAALNVTIGGSGPSERNIISGNEQNGIYLEAACSGGSVKGNYIGTDATGTISLGNGFNGILLDASSNNLIGGANVKEGNLISGNNVNGIVINECSGFSIKGNFIGTDVAQTLNLGNQSIGILTNGSTRGMIGGPGVREGNVVVNAMDPAGAGIALQNSSNLVVQGNFVGVTSQGSAMPNSGHGIWIYDVGGIASSNSNVIGASSSVPLSGEANTVAYNTKDGVHVEAKNATKFSRIRGNSIYCNGGKGIALVGGSNENVPLPVITASSTTTLSGTSLPSSVVHVYRNSTNGAGCGCEGELYLGNATSDGSGAWTFNYSLPLTVTQVPAITVTQTNTTFSTSEFTSQNAITSQPVALAVCVGSSAAFSVIAAGYWDIDFNKINF